LLRSSVVLPQKRCREFRNNKKGRLARGMRILVVPTTDWLQPAVPTRLHHIFEKINARNEVHVIRFDFGHGEPLETKIIIHEARNFGPRFFAEWTPTYYLANYPSFSSKINQLLRIYDFDVIVLSNFLPAYVAAKVSMKGPKKVFDLSDHFPLSAMEYLPKTSLIRKPANYVLEKLFRTTLARVDTSIVSCYALQTYALQMGAKKVHVILNGVDDNFLRQNTNGEKIREKFNLGDSLVIGFVGAIRDYYDMDSLLAAIKKISRKVSVKFLLLGRSIQDSSIQRFRRKIIELGLREHIVWPNYLPQDKVPEYIDAMDVCTIPLDPSKSITRYLMPVKLWEYLAMGKPVISASLPEIRRQCGQFVNFAITEMDYYTFFMQYLREPEPFIKNGKLAKAEARNHTWNVIASEYEKYLESSAH